MKRSLYLVILLFCLAISSQSARSEDQKKVPMTVEELSANFFELVMSPSSLILGVTDEQSLDKAIKELNSNAKKIGAIAKDLKTLGIPNQERRKVIDARFTKKELAMRKGIGVKFKSHLEAMPQDLRVKWQAATRAFYGALDKEGSTFESYFSGKTARGDGGGTDQPAAATESKGKEEPKAESKGRAK